MGICRTTMIHLIDILKDKECSGSTLTLGVQGVEAQYRELQFICSKLGYDMRELAPDEILYDDKTQFGNTIHQSVLFKSLGYEKVDALDFSSFEQAEVIKLRLNQSLICNG